MELSRYRHRDFAVTDHGFDVPLDHGDPGGERIDVFVREVVRADLVSAKLPPLLFLQGGPGGKSPRPPEFAAWMRQAASRYRVLLLDQRGTGRSTPANRQSLARLGSARDQADYLAHFRADSIVRDAELIRREMLGGSPWSLLGQSFGGFCIMTYLSIAPEGVREAFVTGGLPPLSASADDVYRVTYGRTREKNEAYFARYPEDRDLCARVLRHVADKDVRLPTGERLTPRRFQSYGMRMGARTAFEAYHFQLEEAFVSGHRGEELSDTFLASVSSIVSLAPMPLYAVVHEPSFCQGVASQWSAERVLAEFPEFSVREMLEGDQPFLFGGEMIYPFMFDEDPALSSLWEPADLLAQKSDWPTLYDLDRLSRNEVPVWAAVYYDDMYVVREYSLETAATVPNVHPWITNAYEHDGIREGGTAVLDHLFSMADRA